MPGRRAVALAALASAAAFGGGVAMAATHGSSTKPVVKKPAAVHKQLHKQMPRNAHYGCHHDHSSGAALNL